MRPARVRSGAAIPLPFHLVATHARVFTSIGRINACMTVSATAPASVAGASSVMGRAGPPPLR